MDTKQLGKIRFCNVMWPPVYFLSESCSVSLKDTLRECRPGDDACVSYLSWVAPICLITFVVVAQFVLVNLVVAAITQALEDSDVVQLLLFILQACHFLIFSLQFPIMFPGKETM